MKKYILSIGLFIPVLLFGQIDRSIRPTAGKAPIINIKDSEIFKTENGITVILSENHKIPKVSFKLVSGASPMIEGSKAGLSNITGELIMSGTTSRSKDVFDNEKDYIGASLNSDNQSIYLSCLTKHMDKGLTLMSDVLMNANFPVSEFERVKGQNLDNLLAAKSDPETMANNAESKANFSKGHPYGEIMTEETLNNITNEDVKNCFKQIFTPNGSYLVIVGDISLENAKLMVEKYFASWKGGSVFKQEIVDANFHTGNRVIFVNKPSAVQSVVNISFPVKMKPGDINQLPINVLNNILGGGGFGTRLMANLREDKAYTYGCYSSLNITEDGSWFSASGNFRNDITDSAITQILFELDNITKGTVNDEELNLTKMTMAGNFARSLENPQTVAKFALNIIKNNLSKDYYQTYLKRLEAITKEDVLKMAQNYFSANNCNIVVVGNIEVLEKLKKFDSDGFIEKLDAYGEEIKEIKRADISKEQLVEKYILAVTHSSNIKEASKKIKKIKSVQEIAELKIAQFPFPIKSTKIWSNKSIEGEKIESQDKVLQKSFFDGEKGATSSIRNGEVKLTAAEIASKKKSIGLFPEMNYALSAMHFDLLGIENIKGVNYYVIKTNDDTKVSISYYDKTTFMKVKTVETKTEGGEIVETTLNYSDFKLINGVLFPQSIIITSSKNVYSVKVLSTIVNGKVDLKPYL